MHNHVATTDGIVRNSILNTTRFFHVATGLPIDIMHDLLEGSLHVVVKELLKDLVYMKKLFSVKQLNDRIKSFAYGHVHTKSKPSQIIELSQEITISQSGKIKN